MQRALLKSPRSLYPLGPFLLTALFLTGAKFPPPGEVVWQEGVLYRVEGRHLQEVGKLRDAVSAYRKAVVVRPDYAEAYNDLGVVLESLEDFKQAEEAYLTALKFKPDFGAAHSNLALLYEGTQRLKEAATHWGARVRLGPPGDPWVVKAREKLTQYQFSIPETAEQRAQDRSKEIRFTLESGRAHLEAKRYDKAIEEFERVLRVAPANPDAKRLLRSAKMKAQRDQGRQARELETSQARVKKKMGLLEREHPQEKKLKVAASRLEKEMVASRRAEAGRKSEGEKKKNVSALQLKEVEQARKKATEAEQRAQQAEAQRAIESAKRIEAEKRAEEIEKRVAVEAQSREKEKASRQVEEAKRRAAEAERRAEIARKAAEAARLAAQAASQTYLAAKQTVESAKETEEMVKQTEAPRFLAPAPVKETPKVAPPVKAVPVPPKKAPKPAKAEKKVSQPVKNAPAETASSDAMKIAREIAREKSQTRDRSLQELNHRATTAMREGRYPDAVDTYKQILMLDPNNKSAKQGLERAQKALVKASR